MPAPVRTGLTQPYAGPLLHAVPESCPSRADTHCGIPEPCPGRGVICTRKHRGHHEHSIAAWKAKRGDFDELPRPEHEICLGKEHNLELASHGFPAAVVYDLGKSFAQSVDRMKQCAALGSAFGRTLTTSAAG